MPRLREHVHRLRFQRAEAAVFEDAQVPREGGGVAGHVHDALRSHGDDRLQEAPVAAFARRIDDDEVGPDPLFPPAGKDGFRLARLEGDVADPVDAGVEAGVFDGVRHDFHAVHAAGMPGEKQGDGADAAVGVDDRLFSGQAGIFQRLVVQFRRLHRVDLEEGTGRNDEFDVPDLVPDRVGAPQDDGAVAHDFAGWPGVDVEAQAGKAVDFRAEQTDEFILAGQAVAGGDEHDHEVAGGEAAPDDRVAQEAAAGLRIPGRQAELVGDAPHRVDRLFDAGMPERKMIRLNDVLRARCIEAGNKMPVFLGEGGMDFVPVADGIIHADDRMDPHMVQPADALQAVDDHLPFGFQLGFVSHVRELGAAAVLMHPAKRRHATNGFGHESERYRTDRCGRSV